MSDPIITSMTKSFWSLFISGTFSVPWHQRKYDWESTHVVDLLDDILYAYQKGDPCYFLGSIMLIREDEKQRRFEINDGQQRMVTFSLICAALCRDFNQTGEQRHENLALRLLFDIDERSTNSLEDADNLTARLVPPADNKMQYEPIIKGDEIGRNGKLTTAWLAIKTFLQDKIKTKSEKVGFFEFLIKRVEVVCLYIPQKVDKNSVFEVINNRGKQLEAYDLLRNHIYSFFDNEENEAMRNTVHSKLDEIPAILSKRQPAEYARCYFQCRYGYLPKFAFYRLVKKEIDPLAGKNKQNRARYVFNLIEDFAAPKNAFIYKLIINPDMNDPILTEVKKYLPRNRNHDLFSLLLEMSKYSVAHPVIFSCLYVLSVSNKDDDSAEKKRKASFIFTQLINLNAFVMRTAFVTQSFQPSAFSETFSKYAQDIMHASSSSSLYKKKIIDQLQKCDDQNIIDDDSFKNKLSDVEIKENERGKLFLYGILRVTQPDGAQIINFKKCWLEHILPKSDRYLSGWNFDSREHRDNKFKLGNLALLRDTENKTGKRYNDRFQNKVPTLKSSSILATKVVAESPDWNPTEVAKRQKTLVKYALKAWRFSV